MFLLIVWNGSTSTYTAGNLPVRSVLAVVSLVIALVHEVQSRRAFTLEHDKVLVSKGSHTRSRAKGGKGQDAENANKNPGMFKFGDLTEGPETDWFNWGDEDLGIKKER